ncbi:hypothetical protein chiPu_0027861, partial [Chiloscyllium punctatum]|nr:hypothetical protein [Chiloscyllium punctatum]
MAMVYVTVSAGGTIREGRHHSGGAAGGRTQSGAERRGERSGR